MPVVIATLCCESAQESLSAVVRYILFPSACGHGRSRCEAALSFSLLKVFLSFGLFEAAADAMIRKLKGNNNKSSIWTHNGNLVVCGCFFFYFLLVSQCMCKFSLPVVLNQKHIYFLD